MKCLTASVLTVLGLLAPALARAEVAVRTIGQHQFKSLRVDIQTQSGQAFQWRRVSGPLEDDYLNPDGDARGDLPPQAVLLPAGRLQEDPTPLVVWGRQEESRVSLHWSIWTRIGGWSEPRRLTDEAFFDEAGVHLLVDPRGDVHAAWWTNSEFPVVSYAKFRNGAWQDAERLSHPFRDSRSPSISLTLQRQVVITWEDWTTKPVRVSTFLGEHCDP